MYNIGCHLNFIGKSRETFGHWSPGTEAMTANLIKLDKHTVFVLLYSSLYFSEF